jgi:hypothetical protein
MKLLFLLAIFMPIGLRCFSQNQQINIPNPSLPNINPQVRIPNFINQVSPGYNWQEAQREEIEWVDEQIKRTDPTMRKIYYGEPKIIEVNARSRIKYDYPVNKSFGKVHFENALKEIMDMVEKRKPYNLKRAVFLTEHAYDTTLDYSQFERQISRLVQIIQLKMSQDKINPNDHMGKIMTVFKFMADTITVKHPVLEKRITTYPKIYDFEDFYGINDYHKMFVSKLIRTGKGQCHSLPLLFLILCQEINATAYLSFSPEHSYVKFKDKTGVLQNIELTNQMFTTDQFILHSGYVKSPAIKSKIYMDTLGLARTVLYTLNDLSNSYVRKYGYDDFVLQCADKILPREPKSIHTWMHVANYFTNLGFKIKRQYDSLGLTDADFQRDERFKTITKSIIHWNDHIDNLGYAEMPPDIYLVWLKSLKNEAMRQQYIEKKRMLTNMIEH